VKYILPRCPSPALVVACIALFISLGGVSYAVATGSIDSREIRNNTVSSKDVRNNSLRTFDIRNNEIRGFDVRNSSLQGRDIAFNTLTGADINESTLGAVPSATSAGSAASVANLKTFATTAMGTGDAQTLLTHGPLTLSVACLDVGGENVAQLRVQTTEALSAGTGVGTIEPSDGVVSLGQVTDPVGPGRVADNLTVFASAPSGKAFTGEFGLVAATGGTGFCSFNGHVVLEG
jgi:hypothetical protein